MPSCYFIAPKAPLVFRRGQPFGTADRAETLPFPLPAAVAGALRGAWGEHQAKNYGSEEAKAFRALGVAGPLLARRALDGSRLTLFFPKPADAVYESCGEIAFKLRRLQPLALQAGEGTDLPAGVQLVQVRHSSPQKPVSGPAFWTLDLLTRWLAHDFESPPLAEKPLGIAEIGIGELPLETRTHVNHDPARHAARTGYLFQTTGLDFGPRRCATDRGWDRHEYGLFTYSEIAVPPTFHTVGGRSRLAYLEPYPPALWPRCPPSLAQALRRSRGVRLVLATPAVFEHGWRPAWLQWERGQTEGWRGQPPGLSLTLELKALALDRWQPASNWDALTRGPTSIRRLVPAGAVYWFEIVGGIAADLAKLWLAPLSDDEQARRDGFGLAVPGVWNPKAVTAGEEH